MEWNGQEMVVLLGRPKRSWWHGVTVRRAITIQVRNTEGTAEPKQLS
jgi:hypothetical protein